MWDKSIPVDLLKEFPPVLSQANLARIQSLIDQNKFFYSAEIGRDLCGTYAPFCAFCDKGLRFPCAVAFVKMKQAQGEKVEIAPEPKEEEPPKKYIRIAIARRKK